MLREDGDDAVGLETDDVLEAFQVLYQSGGCIEAFHYHRGTKSLVIGPWSDAGTRTVDYDLSIKAPAFVTNIVGSDLSVSESQTVTWTDAHGNKVPDPFHADSTPSAASASSSESALESPAAYTIASVPTIQTTGGDRFVTELSFKFKRAGNTVAVTCSLQVEAKIWGLQSTLEPYMLSEAKKQLAEFVPFLVAYFREHSGAPMISRIEDTGHEAHAAASPKAAAPAPVSPQVPPFAPSSTAGAVDALSQGSRSSSEHFYDALEEVPKGVRAAVQIFEAVKEEASPRTSLPGRLAAKSPNARSRASTASPVARPASPMPQSASPLQHPPAVSTAAPVTPPEPATDSLASTPAPVVAQLQDVNAKLQLECAALRLDAAERRFRSLADATEVCLRQLSASAAPAEPADASWGRGVGVGFFVGVVFGFGAAAALSWGGPRGGGRR